MKLNQHLGVIFSLCSALAISANTSFEVQTWRDGAKAAHTIAHDDYCGGSVSGVENTALPILNERGLKASLGLIAGSCKDGDWAKLKKHIAEGHELFNHSLTHVGMLEAGSLTPIAGWNNEKEIASAHQLVKDKLGYTMQFMAYPSDLATPEAKAYLLTLPDYLGARAAKHIYDGSNAGINSANNTDPFFIKNDVYWHDGKWSLYKPAGGNMLIQHVDAALENGGWSYRTMHGVADGSWEAVPKDQYIAYADYLQKKVASVELWLAGPSEIIRYQATRENCPLVLTGNTLKLKQNNELCQRYASAITVDVQIADESQGRFTQNKKPLPSKKIANGKFRIQFNPALGDLSIN
nr:polysaccharide deacetylase family protein [uncultured Deefgea sp.]